MILLYDIILLLNVTSILGSHEGPKIHNIPQEKVAIFYCLHLRKFITNLHQVLKIPNKIQIW